jgi:guanylate kinase
MTGAAGTDRPLLVFIGPSGSGKSSLVRRLHRRGVIAITPSFTTRPRRADERQGCVEHRFVTEAQFTQLEESGFFLEVVRLFGLNFRYGLAEIEEPEDDRVCSIMVRAVLMPLVNKHFPNSVVYQIEDEIDRVRRRLQAREGQELGDRLAGFHDEVLLGRSIANRVFRNSGSIEKLVSVVAAAIQDDFAAANVQVEERS